MAQIFFFFFFSGIHPPHSGMTGIGHHIFVRVLLGSFFPAPVPVDFGSLPTSPSWMLLGLGVHRAGIAG